MSIAITVAARGRAALHRKEHASGARTIDLANCPAAVLSSRIETSNSPYVVVATPMSSNFTDAGLTADTTYVYAVKAVDASSNIGPASIDIATTIPTTFTDSLAPGVVIEVIHITELRSSLDAARALIGVSAMPYTDPSLASGDSVKAAHVQQLRIGVK